MRLALAALLALAAASGQAQGVPEAGPLAEARAALAAGDSARAHAVAVRALRGDPADALGLLRLRLALERRGVGLRAVPLAFRRLQVADLAEAVLRLAPADSLARLTLLDDAALTAVEYRDRVSEANFSAQFVGPMEVRARLNRSRFDLGQRAEIAPTIDASAPAGAASEAARAHVAALAEAGALSPLAVRRALAVLVADADWPGALRLAEAARPSAPAEAALAEGVARHRLGDAEAAGAAFERALAALPAPERARLLDLRPLLTPGQRAAYTADPDGFAEAFWAAADPRRLTAVNERRVEHLARAVEADVLFGRPLGDLFSDRPPRGLGTEPGRIWVRYGRPPRSASFTLSPDDIPAYAEDTFGPRTPPYAVWEYDGFRFVFDDPTLTSDYRTYSPPAGAYGNRAYGSAPEGDDYVAQDRRMQRDDPARTRVAPTVGVPVLVSRFRDAAGRPEAVVAYGVPVEAGARLGGEAGVFALRDGAVVAEQTGAFSGRVTLRAEGTTVAVGAATVPTGGADAVRAEVAAGDAWGATEVAIEPLPGGFGLSDLLLAASVDGGGAGPVVRDGLAITPTPWGVFATGDPVYVYVEAYGLAVEDGRTRYAVEAALVPEARRRGLLARILGRGGGPAVSVATEAEGDRPTEATTLALDASGQPAGRYTLRLEVTDLTTGRTASAARAVVLE